MVKFYEVKVFLKNKVIHSFMRIFNKKRNSLKCLYKYDWCKISNSHFLNTRHSSASNFAIKQKGVRY